MMPRGTRPLPNGETRRQSGEVRQYRAPANFPRRRLKVTARTGFRVHSTVEDSILRTTECRPASHLLAMGWRGIPCRARLQFLPKRRRQRDAVL